MSQCTAENKNRDAFFFWRLSYERGFFKEVREKTHIEQAHNDHWIYLILLTFFLQLTTFKSPVLQQVDAFRAADLTGTYSGVALGTRRWSPDVEQRILAQAGIAKNRSAK